MVLVLTEQGIRATLSLQSCRKITANLSEAYKETFPDCYIPKDINSEPPQVLAKRLLKKSPSKIVFIGESSFICRWIKTFSEVTEGQLPPLYFHIDGSFVRFIKEWNSVGEFLIGKECFWISPSRRYQKLITKFLQCSSRQVPVFPFPVSIKNFFYDPKSREKLRSRLGLTSGSRAWLYSGRFSSQKNVLSLVKIFSDSAKVHRNDHLFLCGHNDFFGSSLFKMGRLPFFQSSKWIPFLKSLPSDIRNRIHLMGQLDETNIAEMYNACDVFVSLSTFHDENFGMAAAEALCCGLPLVLSNWGGYADLVSSKIQGHLIPLKLTPSGWSIKSQDVINKVNAIFKRSTKNSRQQLAAISKDLYSFKNVSQNLKWLHSQPVPRFKGMSDLAKEVAQKKYLDKPGSRGLYRTLYNDFAGLQSQDGDVLLTSQWFKGRAENQKATPYADRSAGAFMGEIDPFGRSYFSAEYSQIFLSKIHQLKDLEIRKQWLIRDGSYGLKKFFERVPKPKGLQAKLYISKDLLQFVPKDWKKNVGTYTLFSVKDRASSKPSGVLVTGPLHRNASEMKKVLERDLVPFIQQKRNSQTPLLFLFLNDKKRTVLPVLEKYLGRFKTRPRFLTWDVLIRKESYYGYQVIYLNDNYWIADDFILHLLLARQATCPQVPSYSLKNLLKPENDKRILWLSENHGFFLDP